MVDVALAVSGDPTTRSGRTSGSRRTDDAWQLDAALVALRTSDGTAAAVDLPVRVLTSDDVGGLLPGSVISGSARVLPADPLRGRAATLVVSSIHVVSGPPAVQGIAGALRSALRASVAQRPRDEAGLLPGLVVGDTSGVPDDLDRAMRDSGLAHLTAVSVGNVAVIVLLALAAVRAAGVRRGRLQVVLVGAVVAGYVVVARPEPSVVRAAGMTAVVLAALLLDVRVRAPDALGIAVGALVLLDPFLALSVGFAMSAAATAGLVLLASRWRPRTDGPWPVRVVRGAVMIDERHREIVGDRVQPVVLDVRQQLARELDGAQMRVRDAVVFVDPADLVVEKPHIEIRVVRDEHRIADEIEKIGGDLAEFRLVADHPVGDAGELRDKERDRRFRVDERVKFVGDLAVLHAVRADLGDPARRRLGAGRFEVENDVIGLVEPAVGEFFRDQLDRVLVHLEARVGVDQVEHERFGEIRRRPFDLHHVIDDFDCRSASAGGLQKLDRFIY